jgi:photosystem II stability/assembly factor-like uncharacterized protein
VYAATDHGLFWSTDGGQVWAGTPDVPTRDVRGIAVDPGAPSTIYAASFGGGVFKTTDGGRSWNTASTGLSRAGIDGLQLRAIAVAPSSPSIIYAAGPAGIFRSSDGAASWNHVSSSFSSVKELAVHPLAPLSVWGVGGNAGTGAEGVIKSVDGGATLVALGSVSFFWFNHQVPDIDSIAFDRTDPNTVYVGRTGGIARSRDGGASWQPFSTGLPEIFGQYGATVDATAPGRLYAAANNSVYRADPIGGVWQAVGDPLPGDQAFTRSDGRFKAEISARAPRCSLVRPLLALMPTSRR